jgi:hypothetical protein
MTALPPTGPPDLQRQPSWADSAAAAAWRLVHCLPRTALVDRVAAAGRLALHNVQVTL